MLVPPVRVPLIPLGAKDNAGKRACKTRVVDPAVPMSTRKSFEIIGPGTKVMD